MSGDAVAITHAQALRLIDEQVDERVYLALFISRAESESGEEGPMPFIQKQGRLWNPFGDRRPPRLEEDIGYYSFDRDGVEAFPFPPLTGTTQLRDNGIDFLISETTQVRVAWQGSKEIGDGPDAGKLGRLRILGLAGEEEARDDASLDLRRFLGEAKRAKAEIRSASPANFSFNTKSGEKRRIWELKVRVMPADEPAFDASAEVAWPLSRKIEERLDRGEFVTGVPDETAMLDVAFDQGNREQVMALAPEEVPMPRFRAMIIGSPSDPPESGAPS